MELEYFYSIDEAVASVFGNNLHIAAKRPVYGGDINDAYCVSLSDGTAFFMKCNSPGNLCFFEAEAKGLKALRSTAAIGIPTVYCLGTDKRMGVSFLMMEYLEASPRIPKYWETFGNELALLHRAAPDIASDTGKLDAGKLTGKYGVYGFDHDNYIGATLQKNTPAEDWIPFFRDCRLRPQIHMAKHYFDRKTLAQFTKLMDNLESYLTEPAFPSLIHGDLWSGNAICGPDGKAWIIDPAAYIGHFEAELAMTELFGGYPASFYKAYNDINPIDNGYRDRRDLYNLYHLINHLNLFGSSYLGSVKRILNRYVSN